MITILAILFVIILWYANTKTSPKRNVAVCNLSDPFCRVWNHRDASSKCNSLCKSQSTGKYKKMDNQLVCECSDTIENFSSENEREENDKMRFKNLIFG